MKVKLSYIKKPYLFIYLFSTTEYLFFFFLIPFLTNILVKNKTFKRHFTLNILEQ